MCGFLALEGKEYSLEVFSNALKELKGRGPDQTDFNYLLGNSWGFNRLSIMDLTSKGMQPFEYDQCVIVCNGEIYNYLDLKKNIQDFYTCHSGSDCEILLPLYKKYGIDVMIRMLDGEFAFVLYDDKTKKL